MLPVRFIVPTPYYIFNLGLLSKASQEVKGQSLINGFAGKVT